MAKKSVRTMVNFSPKTTKKKKKKKIVSFSYPVPEPMELEFQAILCSFRSFCVIFEIVEL